MLTPFHVAFPVDDLQKARDFYVNLLGCTEGRSAETWIDFSLFGHQIVAHHRPGRVEKHYSKVDGDDVPVPHFGVVLTMTDWENLAKRLSESNVQFVIEPHIRFKGETGEQATMFLLDPSQNALEFKAFAHMDQIFAK